MADSGYLFTSERLGFRNWRETDLPKMTLINADPKVMAFFPSTYSTEQTQGFLSRMQQQFEEKGFCYFAAERLEDQELIGFIGIAEQKYEAPFTPCIDIGWRLHPQAWYKGYATEGAKRCLAYAFDHLQLREIKAIAPAINIPSIRVMEKIGMKKEFHFKHPLLKDNKKLEECVLYGIRRGFSKAE